MDKSNIIKLCIKLAIMSVVAVILIFFVLNTNKYFNEEQLSHIVESGTRGYYESVYKLKQKILSDAFIIPGALFVLFGFLFSLTNQGSLTAVSYSLKRFVKMMIPFVNKDIEKYVDYANSRKKVSGYYPLYIVGGLLLTVGIIFTILFFN
ncbi:MAG: DUF3899 domain-containing protein [Anaeroplasmataceae bacterium]